MFDSIDPRKVWVASQAMMKNAEERGGVEAVIADVKANYGVDLTPDQVRNVMCCGGVVVLMAIGQAVAAGVMTINKDRLHQLMGEMESEAPAPKSKASNDDKTDEPSITLDAERAAADVLARIRKLH